MDKVLEKINALADTSRRNKVAKIRELIRHDELFKKVLIYATSDTMHFNMTVLPRVRYNDLKFRKNQKKRIISEIFSQLDVLSKKKKPTVKEKQYLAKLADKINARGIINRILQKSLRCGVSALTAKKAFPGIVQAVPYKRCETESKIVNIKFPAYCEEEYKGMVINILVKNKKIKYISKDGKTYPISNKKLEREVLEVSGDHDIALVGICTTKTDKYSVVLTRILRGEEKENDQENVIFIASEIIPLDDFWNSNCSVDTKTRYESSFFLKLSSESGSLRKPRRKIVKSYQEAKSISKKVIKNDGMGVLVKDFRSFWSTKNTKLWVSIRKSVYCKLEIVSYDQEKNLLYCKSKDSFIKSIIQKGVKRHKNKLSPGFVCEVRFAEIISDPRKVSRSLFNAELVKIVNEEANTLKEVLMLEGKTKKRKRY